MKIEVARDKLLSNYEVYQHLVDTQKENSWFFTVPEDAQKDGKRRKKRRIDSLIDLEIITKDLSKYLVQNNQSNDTHLESIVNLMLGLNMYKLEKIEKLQILNTLPRSMVILYALVEECDQRFTEDQCEELLSLVNDNFPLPEEEEAPAANDNASDVEKAGVIAEDSGHLSQLPEEEEEEEDVEMFESLQEDLEHEAPGRKVDPEKEIDE